MAADYDLFRKGVKAALLAGLHAWPRTSRTSPWPPSRQASTRRTHTDRGPQAEYKDIVTEVLGEVVLEGEDLVDEALL